MKKYIITMQIWLACALLMTACSDLDEQVEQLMVQKEQTETIAPNENDESVAETKTVEYTNVQTIALTTHGTLKEKLGDNLTTTDKLILSGPIDATDVDVFRNQMTALKAIDMTDVTFVESDSTYRYNPIGSNNFQTASLKVGIIPYCMFAYLDNFIEIKLPKEVTQLGTRAFEDCSSLQTIELPENLETLGEDYVFGYCSSLSSIVIPEKIEVITYSCFVQCSSLKSVTLPQNLKGIEHEAFYGCSALSSIELPKKLVYIDMVAFGSCSSLESITIPASVTNWGAFYQSTNRAFANCTNLSSVILEEGLTVLGLEMFENCTALKQIEIPSSVKEIPYGTFRYCSALEKVVVNQGVEKIGDFAFFNCESLTAIDLPEGLLEIGNSAFSSCTALEKVVVNQGVEKIGDSAFSSCESLTTIELPETLLEIGNSAFYGCPFTVIDFLPNSLTKIGGQAFGDNQNLTTVILPDNVEILGAAIFNYCPNLKNVTLSKNLKEIGHDAFKDTAIENIILPESLTTLDHGAFMGCKFLKEIKIPELITVIPDDCFHECWSLGSVTLPDGITHIGYKAFWACNSLTNVKLPSSLTFLGYESFAYCSSLTLASPVLPESLTTMETDVFRCDGEIKELVFPTGLTEIPKNTCYECHALERVVISEGTTKIEESAFKNAYALTEVTLPSTMKVIGYLAFENAGITSLSFLSDGIETIDNYAFRGCPIKDKVITLPSITSIGYGAFENNKTIGAIYITGTQDVVIGDIFGKASNCLIYAAGKVTLPTNEHIYNKITNGTCLKLRLVEDSPWYCPEPFKVGIVTLTKQFNQPNYSSNSPSYAVSGKASNWYAFNMPFVPTEITSADGRTWAPFNADVEGTKPFWLRKLTTNIKKPFVDVTEIEADVPYIISFPCNENYDAEYNLCGDITFTATNITIPKTGDQIVLSGPYYSMFSSYEPIPQASSVYLLNSAHYNPDGVRRNYSDIWGSAFEQSLRESWTWEPYISFSSPTTTRTISLDGASTRSHKEVGSIPSIDDM